MEHSQYCKLVQCCWRNTLLSITSKWCRVYLLALEWMQDGEVSGVLQGEDDDFAGVVEAWGSSNKQTTTSGRNHRCDCITWRYRENALQDQHNWHTMDILKAFFMGDGTITIIYWKGICGYFISFPLARPYNTLPCFSSWKDGTCIAQYLQLTTFALLKWQQ